MRKIGLDFGLRYVEDVFSSERSRNIRDSSLRKHITHTHSCCNSRRDRNPEDRVHNHNAFLSSLLPSLHIVIVGSFSGLLPSLKRRIVVRLVRFSRAKSLATTATTTEGSFLHHIVNMERKESKLFRRESLLAHSSMDENIIYIYLYDHGCRVISESILHVIPQQ